MNLTTTAKKIEGATDRAQAGVGLIQPQADAGMASHTEGPWKIRRSLTQSDYVHICSDRVDNIGVFRREEDAVLAAAAPELLDLARGIAKRFYNLPLGQQAASIIAKAEGRA